MPPPAAPHRPNWSLVTDNAATIRRAATRYARSPLLEADDLFQEAAIKVASARVDQRRYKDVQALVYRLAARACLDALRRVFGHRGSYRRAAMSTRSSLDAPNPTTGFAMADLLPDESAPDPASTTEQEWAQHLVWRLLAATTNHRRDLLQEIFLEGALAVEIARRRGVTEAAVSRAKLAGLADLADHYHTLTAA